MAKGKHVVANVASDQEAYLEDEYNDLFAEVDNLADAENEAHFDGVEMDGIEFDGGDNDGADLDRGDFDGAEMDGVNFVPPDADVPESSNSRRGVNMGARQNKRLKTKKGKIVVQYNEMGVPAGDEATELASFIGVLARTSVSILYSDWRKVPLETKECLWKSVMGRFIVHPRSRK
ncbi:hypothetical protein AB3S75_003137 [Citrus x aurantiifolia]